MSFPLPFGIRTLNPVFPHHWAGPFLGNTEAEAKAAANAFIPSGVRLKGMEVVLYIAGVPKKYWYYNGTTDTDLIPFSSESATTETDPTVPSHVKTITTTQISNWDAAFGWGNHASAGYLTTAVAAATYIPLSQKGAASGVTPLNSSSKIDEIYLPDSILGQVKYIGTWNASTNTPTLPTPATANKGNYYIVTVAGTQFSIDFNVGDWVISDGTAWSKVDNTDAISSFNGRTGAITLISGDVTTALGYTPINPNGTTLQYFRGDGSLATFPTAVSAFSNDAGYLTTTTGDARYSQLGHTHTFASLTAKPSDIAGYGITDAYTKTEINNFFAGSTAITGYNKSLWDTAYGWGNHALAGYVTTTVGDTRYILNQTSQQASSNFNISGNGTIGGNLSVTGTSTLTGSVDVTGTVRNRSTTRMDGNVGIGSVSNSSTQLQLLGSITGAASSSAINVASTIQSGVTTLANIFISNVGTAAASFTLPDLKHFRVSPATFGAGSTVTTQEGFIVESTMTGATNNYGFRGRIASGTGRWNLYMDGTAANHVQGDLLIGTTSNPNNRKLIVSGNAEITSNTTIGGTLDVTGNSTFNSNVLMLSTFNPRGYITSQAGALFNGSLGSGSNELVKITAGNSSNADVALRVSNSSEYGVIIGGHTTIGGYINAVQSTTNTASNLLLQTNGGNVLIGTTTNTNSRKLLVSGNSEVVGSLFATSFIGSTSVTAGASSAYSMTLNVNGTAQIGDGDFGSSTTITTGPSQTSTARLFVLQNISGGANIYLGGSTQGGGNGTSPRIFFGDFKQGLAAITSSISAYPFGADLIFETTNNISTTPLTERLRIASTGAATFSSSVTANSSFISSTAFGGTFTATDGTNQVNFGSYYNTIGSGNSYDAVIRTSNASAKVSFFLNGAERASIASTGAATFSSSVTANLFKGEYYSSDLQAGLNFPSNNQIHFRLGGVDSRAILNSSGEFISQRLIVSENDQPFAFNTNSSWGGWARALLSVRNGSGTMMGAIGAYGNSGTAADWFWIGKGWGDFAAIINLNTKNLDLYGDLGISGTATAGKFVATSSGNAGVFTSTGTSGYGLVATGSAGGARDIFIAGQSGFSNGFTVQYNGSAMVYQMLNGNLTVGGSVTATGGGFNSDINDKTDIQRLRLNLSQLRGAEYLRKSTGQREYGYIAQEVLPYLPMAVYETDRGLAVSYHMVNAARIDYIQDEVSMLKDRVKQLESQIKQMGGTI